MRRRIAPDFETYVKAVERMKRQMAGHNPTTEELNILCQLAGGILENVPEEREYALKITRYIKECIRLFFANGDTSYASVYTNVLLVEARNRVVDSALIYLEKNRQPDRKFYMPRREMFLKQGIIQGLQDLLDDKLDFLSVSLPPGVGKTTIEIFFLSLIGGYWPNCFNLSSAHSSIMTRSIFDGIAEIIDDPVEYCWHEIFPDVHERSRSAKDTVINMGRAGRFKTWTMRSIDGSLTGATRANLFLTMDDMVSGIEEALNKTRMETLWVKVSNDLLSRRMDGCKTLCFATRWSVHDPIGKLQERNSDNPRARFIAVPALDEDGNSNFDYPGGFTTKYFMQQKDFMDDISFDALYQQKPIEREGLLFPSDQIRRFVKKDKDRYTKDGQLIDSMVDTVVMPDRKPDAIWAVCDTKDKGSDFESMPIAYQYDQDLFIVDVIFDDNTEYEVLDRKTADMLLKYNPHKTKFESNNAGSRVAYTIQSMIDEERRKGKVCRVDIEQQYTTANKETKILVNSSWILKHCYFLHHSQYAPKDDYGKFMSNVCEYTTKGKVPHDDAPDSLAMLAEYVQGFGYAEEAAIVASPLAWRR